MLIQIIYVIYRRLYFIFYWKFPGIMPRVKHPDYVEMELSNECNLYCIHCYQRIMTRERGHMDLAIFKKVIDEMFGYPFAKLSLVGLGESTLNPRFSEMMRYAAGKSIKIELTTNGSLFEKYSFDEILQWDIDIISISVDGIDKESYQQIRQGGDYDKLSLNIRAFYKHREECNRKYPLLTLRNVIFPGYTPEQIQHFKETWKDTTDYIVFNTLSTFNKLVNDEYIRNCHCNELFFDAHIRFNGSVILCQHQCLYDREVEIGHIKTSSLRDIWKSKQLQERRSLHHKGLLPDHCKMCFSDKKKPEAEVNSRRYNISKNLLINLLNKYINVT